MKNKKTIGITVLFAGIACISIAVRMWHIGEPIGDWHSFRQVDTASVARVFTQKGIDLLRPRYHDLSNIQSGKDNPEGWRMVEFPLYQGTAAWMYRFVPYISLETYLRLITIVSSTLTGLLLGIMLLRRHLLLAGIMAFMAYALLPYSIYYGRVILPDPFAVCLAVVALFCLTVSDTLSWKRMLISGVAAGCALLVKPAAAFLLVPALLTFIKKPLTFSIILKACTWAFLAIAPLMWWRMWISGFPEGIPAYDWLFNQNNIRFKGAWFYWLFADRIGRLILGYWGLILLGIGLIFVEKKNIWFDRFLLLGSIAYLVVIAGGNVQHDYYQIMLLPILSIYVGKGAAYLWTARDKQRSIIFQRGLLIVSCAFMFAFSWYSVRTYYWINRPEIIEAGIAADQLIPQDAKVIAPYNGDTTFLYQTKRTGWPLNFDIEKKIAMGATHYVTVSPTDSDLETKELAQTYTVLVRNDKYAIIDLTKKNVLDIGQ